MAATVDISKVRTSGTKVIPVGYRYIIVTPNTGESIYIQNRGESAARFTLDGNAVIIINEVEPKDAIKLERMLNERITNGGLTAQNIQEILDYARDSLGKSDIYPSDLATVKRTMKPALRSQTNLFRYGGFAEKAGMPVEVVYIPGEVTIVGSSATNAVGGKQKHKDGALLVLDEHGRGRYTVDVAEGIAERTYRLQNGDAIELSGNQRNVATMDPETLDVYKVGERVPSSRGTARPRSPKRPTKPPPRTPRGRSDDDNDDSDTLRDAVKEAVDTLIKNSVSFIDSVINTDNNPLAAASMPYQKVASQNKQSI